MHPAMCDVAFCAADRAAQNPSEIHHDQQAQANAAGIVVPSSHDG
jgi:hypothetical protein